MKQVKVLYQIIIVVVLCFASRLPHLLSLHTALDGDECIEALMAKHHHEGKEVPLFFYGQSYGFAFAEVATISVFYNFFGYTDTAVKLAMLLLWTIGVVFFFLTLQQLQHKSEWMPFLFTLLLVLAPSWAVWSMKARGGYITSFMLCSVITYLIYNKKLNKSFMTFLLVGVLLSLTFESQPLWLAGLLPIVIFQLFTLKSWRNIVSTVVGMGILSGVFIWIKSDLSTFWAPSVISLSHFNWTSFAWLPEKIFHNLHGHYAYNDVYNPGWFSLIWACIFTTLVFAGCLWILYRLIAKKESTNLSVVFATASIGVVSYLMLINGELPRYTLPLTGFLLLMLFEISKSINNQKAISILIGICVVFGGFSMFEFKKLGPATSNKTGITQLVNALENDKTPFVFCHDGLLQWQIMFYSRERIQCRYLYNTDRYPRYVENVNEAYIHHPEQTALVAFYRYDFEEESSPKSLRMTPSIYHIRSNPDKQILTKYGFELPMSSY